MEDYVEYMQRVRRESDGAAGSEAENKVLHRNFNQFLQQIHSFKHFILTIYCNTYHKKHTHTDQAWFEIRKGIEHYHYPKSNLISLASCISV